MAQSGRAVVESDPQIPVPGLENLVYQPGSAEPGDEETLAVGFFDLVGSTQRKLTEGHQTGVLAARVHNETCKQVVSCFEGTTVKELGDGVLVTFRRPDHAILAAENFRIALQRHTSLETRVGLALGPVEHAVVDGRQDIFGAAVDRAAKVQSVGAPMQIVMDDALASATRSRVAEHGCLRLEGPHAVALSALADQRLYILGSSHFPEVSDTLMHHFRWYEDGRLTPDAKATYIATATEEIVEIGTTLSTWAGYFEEFAPKVYRDRVFARVSEGVCIRCYVLDPECELVGPYFADDPDLTTARSIVAAIQRLHRVKAQIRGRGYSGDLDVFTYTSTPFAYVSAIDIGRVGQAAPRGRIIASPYLFGMKHAENPMLHFTWQMNETGFNTYRRSIRWLTDHAKIVDEGRLERLSRLIEPAKVRHPVLRRLRFGRHLDQEV